MEPFTHAFDYNGHKIKLSFYSVRDNGLSIEYLDVLANRAEVTGAIVLKKRQLAALPGGWNRWDWERKIREEFESGRLKLPPAEAPDNPPQGHHNGARPGISFIDRIRKYFGLS